MILIWFLWFNYFEYAINFNCFAILSRIDCKFLENKSVVNFVSLKQISWNCFVNLIFPSKFWFYFFLFQFKNSFINFLMVSIFFLNSFKLLISSSFSLRSDSNSSNRDFRTLNSETVLKSLSPGKVFKKWWKWALEF